MANNEFNTWQFNVPLYNEQTIQTLTSNLSVRYSIEKTLIAPLLIDFGIPLERDLDIDFEVLTGLISNLVVEYEIGQILSYVANNFKIDFSVEESLFSSLLVDFSAGTQSELSVEYSVGDIVSASLPLTFSVLLQTSSDLLVDFGVSDSDVIEADLDLLFDIAEYVPSDGLIDADEPEIEAGIRVPDGYEDSVDSWPPTRLCETDSLGRVIAAPCDDSDLTYAIGALSFATEISIINNECVQTHAQRMLDTVPSAVKQMVWEAEYKHQTNLPSSVDLYTVPMTVDGEVISKNAITITRLPADVGRPKDIEVWVSGVAPSGAILPAYEKCLYLRYGSAPNMVVETYPGTVDSISAGIILSSELVDIDSPGTETKNVVTEYSTTIPVVDASEFPNSGYAVLDKEVVYYNSRDDVALYNCHRGVMDTEAQRIASGTLVRSTFCRDREVPAMPPSSIDPVTDYYPDKLANVREKGLINISNSKHLAFWKMVASLVCFIWGRFNDKVNSFFVRFAKLSYLDKLASIIGTRLWHELLWKKLFGHLLSSMEANYAEDDNGEIVDNSGGMAPLYIGISENLYNALSNYGIVGYFRSPKLFKIEDEYVYVSWVGVKANVMCPGIPVHGLPCLDADLANDDNIMYVAYIVERGVEYGKNWSVGVEHNIYADIEYIPTDLRNFSSDAQLLIRARKEPSHLYRERLRLYQGDKSNFPSMRSVYDVLEEVVPGSTIDFWDYYSFVDGINDDPHGPFLDKEIGWLLGVSGRTEIGATTYLGLGTYTQGYWEWLWADDNSQLLQVKGSFPFFVRTQKWWFDPELLYEVTERFKSAGTTPNYSINKEVASWGTIVNGDGETDELSAYNTNLFYNGDMSEGTYSIVGTPVAGSIVGWNPRSDHLNPDQEAESLTLENIPLIPWGTFYNTISSGYGAHVEHTSKSVYYLTQEVKGLAAGDYYGQFYVRADDNITYNSGLSKFNELTVSVVDNTGTIVPTVVVEPYSGDWYIMRFTFTLVGAGYHDATIGLAATAAAVGTGRNFTVANAWLRSGTQSELNKYPSRIMQGITADFAVYTKHISSSTSFSYRIE